nr:MAG TPA: hypothetical protein [Caudoviricetes sp.]
MIPAKKRCPGGGAFLYIFRNCAWRAKEETARC